MTNAGDSGDKPRSEHGDASSGGGYEPPPIEQSQGQSSHESQPGSSQPTSGYPPPSYPPSGGYPPPQGYPPSGSSASGYGAPPSYHDPSGYGAPSYSSQSPYGTPQGGYPPSYSSGYGDYQGGYGAAPAGTNHLAIWSLVASLIGLLCGLGSIAGIVLGIVALNQIKRTRQAGYGLAVAGIVVGAATLVISLIWNIYAFSR